MRLWIAPREFDSLRSPHSWEVVQRPGRRSLKPATAVRVCPSQPAVLDAGVVQRIRTPGCEPGDFEVRILPPVPTSAERRPTGEVPGCLPGLGEFDSRTLRQDSYGDVDKLAKSPALQAGHRGFESRHRYHWPEAHEDEQATLNREAASSILARPTSFCRVAELVQRSTVNREDVGSNPTPTARSSRGTPLVAETGPTNQHS